MSKPSPPQELADKCAAAVVSVSNYPKEGIVFRDITGLLKNGDVFAELIQHLAQVYKDVEIDAIAGTESRGFIFAAPLAVLLKKPFIPIRKKGKLPRKVLSQEYQLEYGTDILEIHTDSVDSGAKVLLIDDLLATGGTLAASMDLFAQIGATTPYTCCIINLPDLGGADLLAKKGTQLYTILDYSGH